MRHSKVCSPSTPELEAKRAAINAFVRARGNFDGVIDFDAATRDPAHPTQFLPAYDSGDHLHPSDAGYTFIANEILAAATTAAYPAPRASCPQNVVVPNPQ